MRGRSELQAPQRSFIDQCRHALDLTHDQHLEHRCQNQENKTTKYSCHNVMHLIPGKRFNKPLLNAHYVRHGGQPL